MKNLLKFFVIALFALFLNSCTDCKECCLVTRTNGEVTEETDCANYCGEELTVKEAGEAVVIGDKSIEWECTY